MLIFIETKENEDKKKNKTTLPPVPQPETIPDTEIVPNVLTESNRSSDIDEEMAKGIYAHISWYIPVGCISNPQVRRMILHLDGELNLPKMFEEYKEWFDPQKNSSKCESYPQYRSIVRKKYKLSFHRFNMYGECKGCRPFLALQRKYGYRSDD